MQFKEIFLLFLILLASACIVKKKNSRDKFISYEHHLRKKWKNNLIKKVHENHWDIGYEYGDDCLVDNRPKAKDLEKAITNALQIWLQPLRKIKTKKPIVNKFNYQLAPVGGAINWKELDLNTLFYCGKPKDRSGAQVFDRAEWPPFVKIDRGTDVNNQPFNFTLIHELGHAMGLGDTYIRGGNLTTKGGLNFTAGTQPAAIMAIHLHPHTNKHLSEDDKNGIIWLYKVEYEALDPNDCFFPNYEFEKTPEGCVPKYPLIFEVRQGNEEFASRVLRDDKNIDINAQDSIGFTALHYAVAGRHMQVVEELLSRKKIKPWLKDKEGRNVLKLAQDLGMDDVVKLIKEVPWSVEKKTKITTWGEMKKEQ